MTGKQFDNADYWTGYYDACRVLLTMADGEPVTVEAVEEQAELAERKARAHGVVFEGDDDE